MTDRDIQDPILGEHKEHQGDPDHHRALGSIGIEAAQHSAERRVERPKLLPSKRLSLAEVKEIYDDRVFETDTSFGVNDFGKFRPNITFIVPKVFETNVDGRVIDPLEPRTGEKTREMVANMNVYFDGSPGVVFGSYWRSKKGGACFRPTSPEDAEHVLVQVSWGGAFDRSRGRYEGGAGELYFRRAASNGGGVGNDYYVFPVGYRREIHDASIDGDTTTAPEVPIEERARVIREQFTAIDASQREARLTRAQELHDAIEASKEAKPRLMPKLEELQQRLAALREVAAFANYSNIGPIVYDDTEWKQEFGIASYYEDRSVLNLEKTVMHWEDLVLHFLEYQPRYEELKARFLQLGRKVAYEYNQVKIDGPNGQKSFSYSEQDIAVCEAFLVESEENTLAESRRLAAAAAKAEIAAAAREQGLPSNVTVYTRRGGATGRQDAWVIDTDGSLVPPDVTPMRYGRECDGATVWDQILPGQLVIKWAKRDVMAPHEFGTIYVPDELTPEQLRAVAEIEDRIAKGWSVYDDRKNDSRGDRSSPPVGRGWGLDPGYTERAAARDELTRQVEDVLDKLDDVSDDISDHLRRQVDALRGRAERLLEPGAGTHHEYGNQVKQVVSLVSKLLGDIATYESAQHTGEVTIDQLEALKKRFS